MKVKTQANNINLNNYSPVPNKCVVQINVYRRYLRMNNKRVGSNKRVEWIFTKSIFLRYKGTNVQNT